MSIGAWQIALIIAIGVYFLVLPLLLAIKKNKQMLKAVPGSRPYIFGFFLAYMYFVCLPLLGFLLIWQIVSGFPSFSGIGQNFEVPFEYAPSSILFTAGVVILFAIIGFGLIQQRQWGWILLVLNSASLALFYLEWVSGVLALLTAYYAWRRWNELRPLGQERKP